MQKYVVVGRFGRPHGVHGWIKVNSFTKPATSILDLIPWLYCSQTGFHGVARVDPSSLDFPRDAPDASERSIFGICEHRERGRNKAESQNAKGIQQYHNEWITINIESTRVVNGVVQVKIVGYDAPETVKILTNVEIAVLRDKLPKLSEDNYYWSDLIGLEVVNHRGVKLGKITELLATGANDVLIVQGERKRLIPYITQVVRTVDVAAGIVTVEWEAEY